MNSKLKNKHKMICQKLPEMHIKKIVVLWKCEVEININKNVDKNSLSER